MYKASTISQTGFSADTYLAGSVVTVAAGAWQAGQQYQATFDMAKTASGVATPIVYVRMGTLGSTGDAILATLTFGTGTAVADTGIFEVWVNFNSVGSGTAAVIQCVGNVRHQLAATGLVSAGAAGNGTILATSAGFNSSTQTKLGLSFNGGTSFVGTNKFIQAGLAGP